MIQLGQLWAETSRHLHLLHRRKKRQAAGADKIPPSFTPVPRTNQPTRAITHPGMSPTGNPLNSAGAPLKNRFAALQQEPLTETSPSHNMRYETRSTQLPPKVTQKPNILPKVLIVGDGAVNGIYCFCSAERTKVLCFLYDTQINQRKYSH